MNQSEVKLCVKLAYTCLVKYYIVSPDMCIKDFIETVKDDAYSYFKLAEEDIEIVEAGQKEDEFALALYPDTATLSDKYKNINYKVAFYIRPNKTRILSLIHPDMIPNIY